MHLRLIMDNLTRYQSIVGPAKVRTLLVPVGAWTRKAFDEASRRIELLDEIRLAEISPIDSPLFTPQGFPQGKILFEFTTMGHSDETDLFLYDFEPFRKIFVVLALVHKNVQEDRETILQQLKSHYPAVVSHTLIDYSGQDSINDNIVPWKDENRQDSEMVLCDIAKNFLIALTHYYSSYKHVTLRSPGAIGGASVIKATLINKNNHKFTSSSGLSTKYASMETNSSIANSPDTTSVSNTKSSLKRNTSLKLSNSVIISENKAQQRAHGRQSKILGNFQLLAGRYIDAIGSFSEAINLLHKAKDYLWLGSALEGISIAFLLLQYLHIPFQIPNIITIFCSTRSLQNKVTKSDITTPRTSVSANIISPRNSNGSIITPSTASIDPSSVEMPYLIKSIADKVIHCYESSLLHNSEYVPQIVYCESLLKTMTFMTAVYLSGDLNDTAMQIIIKGNFEIGCTKTRLKSNTFGKLEIYEFANKIFELQMTKLEIEPQANVYVSLAKTFEILGFIRKQALVLRLLLISILNTPNKLVWNSDFENLLDRLFELYGITDGNKSTHEEIQWIGIQKEILKLSIKAAVKLEAQAKFSRFAVILLSNYSDSLSATEQKDLFARYISPYMGKKDVENYWDLRIVSSLKFNRLGYGEGESSSVNIPFEYTKENPINENGKPDEENDPQTIFNPFKQIHLMKEQKQKRGNIDRHTFLYDDRVECTIALHNIFKFDIYITQLQFDSVTTDFLELDNSYLNDKKPFVIEADSTKDITMSLLIKKPTFQEFRKIGTLRISVMGFDAQNFPIASSRFDMIEVKVLPDQPELELERTSKMMVNSWMMLDGTKNIFTLSFRNRSLSKRIDYLKFSSITNIEKSLKSDYWKKLSPDSLYDLEMQLKALQDKCVSFRNIPDNVEPNGTFEVEMELNLTNAPFEFKGFDLCVEYGMEFKHNMPIIYMKKLELPYEITLRRSIEVPNLDIIPLNDFNFDDIHNVDWVDYIASNQHEIKQQKTNFVLLLIDFKNSWIDGVRINVEFESFKSKHYLVEANHNLRMIIPIRKLDFSEHNFKIKPIPRVFTGRQFVQLGNDRNHEISLRENFWVREYLLERIRCTWELTTDSSVTGEVDFRKFLDPLDNKIVSIIYPGSSKFYVHLSVEDPILKVGDMIEINISVEPILHKQHSMKSSVFLNFLIYDSKSSKMIPKTSNRILYNGTLSMTISATRKTETKLQLTPLEKGVYEICTCISAIHNRNNVLQFNSENLILSVQ